MIVAVEFAGSLWFGHPESPKVDEVYRRARDKAKAEGRDSVGSEWEKKNPLTCWTLVGDDGMPLARAYEPTEATPRWVFTDSRGNLEIERPISHEQLVALIVIYRMKGGLDVDALHLQA